MLEKKSMDVIFMNRVSTSGSYTY